MPQLLPERWPENEIFKLTDTRVLGEIKKILGEFWVPPHEAGPKIQDIVADVLEQPAPFAVVSGENRNVSLYCISEGSAFVYMPFSNVHMNIVLREMYAKRQLPPWGNWHIVPADQRLIVSLR
ncbi:MAG TPA: hypothetical protein VJ302_28355 [Blastocatellia bacterium]|nr:hypothetical protein [Blastocatellia bacterium]